MEAAKRYATFFGALTPADLEHLESVFVADARFVDPFNDVHGVAAIRRVFELLTRSSVLPPLRVFVCLGCKARERRRIKATSRERNAAGEAHKRSRRASLSAALNGVARRSCSDGYTTLLAPCQSG